MTVTAETILSLRDRLEGIHQTDEAVLGLGIELHEVEHGRVSMTMAVADNMANGHGVCHGGFLFTLADSALAYCCATAGSTVLTRNAEITFIAPALLGQTITATATQRVVFGRNQICDVILQADGATVAYFSGQGTTLPPDPSRKIS